MHVAPGHEAIAKEQGWDQFSSDHFREHNGKTQTENATSFNPDELEHAPHLNATVRDAKRSAYPGIYDDPKEIVKRVKTSPESPNLKNIFGTTRKEMHDAVIAQGDVAPTSPMPGITAKGKGSAHALQTMTDENAARIRDTINAFKDHDEPAYHGMVAWYHMSPMYQSIKKILGGNEAAASHVFHQLNTFSGLASPMSSVEPEIRRGYTAAAMHAEGKFDKFAQYGGNPTSKAALKNAPELSKMELETRGHAFHRTANVPAMSRFAESGAEAEAPKTGAYVRASDAPERPGSKFQNTVLVGDSHFSRGEGLADVRGAKGYDGSISGTELKTLHPWYHENVARHPDVNIPATSAQAVQWGAMGHETGVKTAIGAPKLEIWADKIAEAAKEAGVEPKVMWERMVRRLANAK